LHAVSAPQVIAHRVVWSCLIVLGFIALRGELREVRAALAARRVVLRLALSATLISVNWLVYVWAVMHGHVVDASLGYFINPLVNVLLGYRAPRGAAQSCAVDGGRVRSRGRCLFDLRNRTSALDLAHAGRFLSSYGFIRKVVQVEALPGLPPRRCCSCPARCAYLLWCEASGSGAFGHCRRPASICS
jgi:chloramphenicol-sensitive protein RarD